MITAKSVIKNGIKLGDCCNPKFGLYNLYIIYGLFFEEISNTITAKSVKCYLKNGIKLGGCCNPKFGLYNLYIIYDLFFLSRFQI